MSRVVLAKGKTAASITKTKIQTPHPTTTTLSAKMGEGRVGFQQGTRDGRHFTFYSEIQSSFFPVTRGERGQGEGGGEDRGRGGLASSLPATGSGRQLIFGKGSAQSELGSTSPNAKRDQVVPPPPRAACAVPFTGDSCVMRGGGGGSSPLYVSLLRIPPPASARSPPLVPGRRGRQRGNTRKPEKVEYFQPPIRLPRSSLR